MRDTGTVQAFPVAPRQPRAVRQRDALLDATEVIVAAEGLNAATTTRVAHQAGVAVGTVYRYFQDREALILSAYDRTVNRIVDVCSGAIGNLESDLAPADAARQLLEIYLSAARKDPAHAPLLRAMRRIRSVDADLGTNEDRIVNDLLLPFLTRFAAGRAAAPDRATLHVTTALLGMLVDLCLLAENERDAARVRDETEAHMLLALTRLEQDPKAEPGSAK